MRREKFIIKKEGGIWYKGRRIFLKTNEIYCLLMCILQSLMKGLLRSFACLFVVVS